VSHAEDLAGVGRPGRRRPGRQEEKNGEPRGAPSAGRVAKHHSYCTSGEDMPANSPPSDKISTMAAVETRQDVLDRLRRHRDQIQALGVERLGLFGSFVRGEQSARSDVDLLVRFHPEAKSFDRFMALAFLLEDLLQRRVELVTTEGLSPHLGPRILDEVQDVALDT
jgi:uncharacterized protein